MTEAIREHADVVFPAEVYAEKEGHDRRTPTGVCSACGPRSRVPAGRCWRRGAGGRTSRCGAGWQLISELALRLGLDVDVLSGAIASRQLFDAVPFYAGLTLEQIGGRGVRWQEREQAARFPAGSTVDGEPPALSEALERPRRPGAGARNGWLPFGVGRARGRVLAGARVPVPAPRAGERMIATVGYYEPWWIQVIKAIVIFAVGLQLVPVVLLAERKLLGRFQSRYGPNRVGPYGALQPLADILKLLTKEQFRPSTSVGLLFALAPIVSILTAVAAFAIIPFGDTQDIFGTRVGLYGLDVSIGPLYVFAFGGIAFYAIMLGGWASGSKYSFLGAMRGAAQLISYEVSQGLALVGVVITAGTLSLTGIVDGPRRHVVTSCRSSSGSWSSWWRASRRPTAPRST